MKLNSDLTPTRGWQRYATMLRKLQLKPDTVKGLARRMGCPYLALGVTISRLCELGLIRECEWRKTTGSARAAVYAFDGGERVPRASGKLPTFSGKAYRNGAELIAFASIIRLLQKEPITKGELIAEVGCSWNNVAYLLDHCRAIGLARISDWQPREVHVGAPAAMWALGRGADAVPPAPMGPREASRRHQAGLRAKRRDQQVLRALAGIGPANDQRARSAEAIA